MKKTFILALVLLASACATKMPMNVQEAREIMPGSFGVETKEFSVKGNYNKTAKRLKKMAYKCLDQTVTKTSTTYNGANNQYVGASTHTVEYNPTVKVGKSQTVFYLQVPAGGVVLFDEPEEGSFRMVADVFNRNGNNMDVKMIMPTWGQDHINEAVEGWIRGTEDLCPEL